MNPIGYFLGAILPPLIAGGLIGMLALVLIRRSKRATQPLQLRVFQLGGYGLAAAAGLILFSGAVLAVLNTAAVQ